MSIRSNLNALSAAEIAGRRAKAKAKGKACIDCGAHGIDGRAIRCKPCSHDVRMASIRRYQAAAKARRS